MSNRIRVVALALVSSGMLFLADQSRSEEPILHTRQRIAEEESVDSTSLPEVVAYTIDQAHAACFENDPFPSAKKCAVCHRQHYREWSVSPHAYAQLSPVFNAMSSKIRKLTNGTLGDFCIRCHTPVGMDLDEPITMSNLDRSLASREGVTCVACHRVNQAWGKGAGRRALVSGDLTQVVYGPVGSEILNHVLSNPDKYGVLKTDKNPEIKGREVHSRSIRFFQLTTPGFCGSCHDVFAPNGFRLEDAFSEYKMSPAARKHGHNCQDCHMGAVPGEPKGYEIAPAAIVGNMATPPRKHANHMFPGPDYSIIHRGLFPHHLTAIREEGESRTKGLATMREWLCFDDAAGWGTHEFEEQVPDHAEFPAPWEDDLMRRKARRILDEQYELLSEYTTAQYALLRAGYKMGRAQFERADRRQGIDFQVKVWNGTTGHSVPTGFDAERLVFLRVLVWDESGKLVFQSGDLDPNGDVRDGHSRYVHNGELPLDRQLFSLQSMFITRNIRGGEREQILNVPFSLTPLPFIRPETQPFTVLGRPTSARKHKMNIEPEGEAWARYRVAGSQLNGPGTYTVRTQLIAGMVPVNLIHEISDVGFDFGMSARTIADAIVQGHLVLWEDVQQVEVK
ncbi:MAG TPA: multiheme c-type cytochrome [Planctomycetaceae bacterium]|nr:multiheme c-type cytochrome [Planctomycetaceae bacterium]